MEFDTDQISYEDIDFKDMAKLINVELPANMRMDYLKMINDVYVAKPRREEIKSRIIDILTENNYYEER